MPPPAPALVAVRDEAGLAEASPPRRRAVLHSAAMESAPVAAGWSFLGDARWRLPHLAAVAFVPGSPGHVAVASRLGVVQVLASNGDVVASWALGPGTCDTLAVSPDGRTATVGGMVEGPSVILLDLASGAQVPLSGHRGDRGPEVFFCADGRHVVTGDDEGTVRVFTTDGKRVRSRSFKPFTILGVAADREAARLFVAPGMRLVRVDGDGEPVALGAGGPVALSADERWLACAPYNAEQHRGAVWLYAVADGAKGRLGPPDDADVAQPNVVRFVPGGEVLAGYDDGALRLWDPATGARLATLRAHGENVVALDVAADGRRAVSGSADGTIVVWDLGRRAPESTLAMPPGVLAAVALRGDVIDAVHGAAARIPPSTPWRATTEITRWDLATGARLAHHHDPDATVHAASVAVDGEVALLGEHHVVLVGPDGTRRQHPLGVEGEPAAFTSGVAALGGGLVALAGPLRLVDVARGRVTRIATKGEPARVVASVDGRFVLASGHDRSMAVVDVAAAKVVKAWTALAARTSATAVSPSGETVLTAEPGVLRRWSRAKASPVASIPLPEDAGRIEAIVLLDDATALTLGHAGAVQRWDLAAGALAGVAETPFALGRGRRAGFDVATALAVAGGRLVVGGADGTVATRVLATLGAGVAAPGPKGPAFRLAPPYAELVAGNVGPADYEDRFAVRITYARAISAKEKTALAGLYDGWADRLREAAYASLGYPSEDAALADGHPPVRVEPLAIRGKIASGGASRTAGVAAATRWLVDALAGRSGIQAVELGADGDT